MAKILLIETATDVCSVAIAVDGEVVALHEIQDRNSHTSSTTLFIEACCRDADIELRDLDAIAVSKGPGSYTALRVGASVAKGLCYALDKPLIAVSTLASLADAAKRALPEPVRNQVAYYLPMIDARRMEVYTAIFDSNGNLESEEKAVIMRNNLFEDCKVPHLPQNDKNVIVLSGNGIEKLGNGIFSEKIMKSTVVGCSASNLAILAEKQYINGLYESKSYFIPSYLKSPNITKAKNTYF